MVTLVDGIINHLALGFSDPQSMPATIHRLGRDRNVYCIMLDVSTYFLFLTASFEQIPL